jgi:hypothetical protein
LPCVPCDIFILFSLLTLSCLLLLILGAELPWTSVV